MSGPRRFWAKFSDASIRTKYFLSALVLLLMLLICGAYVCLRGYHMAYREYIDTAENDFVNAFQSLDRFESRMHHLATLFQQNEQANELLVSIPAMSSGEHVRARTKLLQLLYTMLDDSGDYLCKLYVNPELQIADSSSRILSLASVMDSQWAQRAFTGWGWRRFYPGSALGASEPGLIAPIRKNTNYRQLIAILRIDLNQPALKRMMSAIKSEEFTSCYLETQDGGLVAASELMDDRIPIKALSQYPLRGFSALRLNIMEWEGNTVFFQTLPLSRWRLVMVVHHNLHLRGILPEYVTLAVIGGLLTLLGLLLGIPILLPVTMRIRSFHQHVLGIHKDGIHGYVEPQANDEIGQLIKAHNGMLLHIEALMKEREKSEQEMRRLEISALQSQIKPHFLYNTLEAVSWMTKKNQLGQVQSTLRNLTAFYRMCLSQGKDVLTVAQELEIVKNYFDVQSVRYEQEFHLVMDVAEEALALYLPKITLQPLVENALMHGILESGQSEGTIRIFSRMAPEGCHELCVADSGAHFTPQGWEKALSRDDVNGEGYGLYNVERRLQLFFKTSRVLYLDDGDAAYSTVVIKFPE